VADVSRGPSLDSPPLRKLKKKLLGILILGEIIINIVIN
jgi:hypothetical protein